MTGDPALKANMRPAPRDISRHPTAATPRRGFTLIEVMISIALVLIVILGVNQVFSLTSQAVGAGQAVSEINRNARNAQAIMFADLAAADFESAPFFLIRGTTIAAFRNRADQLNDLDYVPTLADPDAAIRSIDRNRNGVESDADDRTSRAMLTSRTHRADFLSFFVRSRARRQTGNPGTFSSPIGGDEQYVVYTHLRQLANPTAAETNENFGATLTNTNLRDPGPHQYRTGDYTTYNTEVLTPTNNPYNFYASQWILGRKAMILREPDASRVIRDASNNPYVYYGRGGHPNSNSNPNSRAPYSGNSNSVTTGGSTNTAETVQNSYYDLAGVTMSVFRQQYMPQIVSINGADRWVDPLIYRPVGFPAPSRPLTPTGVARTTPCFLMNCSQFAVEFAGDFLNQDANGNVINYAGNPNPLPSNAPTTDGIVDFYINPANGTRGIRWYGFPRDANGDGLILTGANMNQNPDVLPARDVVRAYFGSAFPGFLFEKGVNGVGSPKFPTATPANYHSENALPRMVSSYPTSYVACWGSETANLPRPTMLRIIFAIDDPLARVGSEQFFEFVAPLR
jgi:prepilin-type N-terminal cleavage/methylation domain-containing protein